MRASELTRPSARPPRQELSRGRVSNNALFPRASHLNPMEERTRAYLRGRFRDHYRRKTSSSEASDEARGRRVDLSPPPDPEAREWGYIPWTSGSTRMVRHQSLLELGEVGDFLRRERPRHVYFSAGRYDDPGADDMDAKGWRGADLVFDIDADHLDGVDPQRDPYAEMLAAGKAELVDLLDL